MAYDLAIPTLDLNSIYQWCTKSMGDLTGKIIDARGAFSFAHIWFMRHPRIIPIFVEAVCIKLHKPLINPSQIFPVLWVVNRRSVLGHVVNPQRSAAYGGSSAPHGFTHLCSAGVRSTRWILRGDFFLDGDLICFFFPWGWLKVHIDWLMIYSIW